MEYKKLFSRSLSNVLSKENDVEMIKGIRQDAWMRIYVLIAVFITLTLFLIRTEPQNLLRLYIVAGIALWPTFLEFWTIKRKNAWLIRNALFISLTSDMIAITAGAHFTSNEILIFVIYITTILTSSLEGLNVGLFEAVLVMFLYPALLALESYNIIPPRFTTPFLNHLFSIAPGIFFGIVVAILMGYSSDSLKKTKKKAQNLANKVRKLYQKSKVSSEIIFEQIEDGFLVVNNEGIIEKTNIIAARFLGTNNLINRNINSVAELITPQFSKLFDEGKSGSHTINITVTKPERRTLAATASPLKVEGRRSVVIILKDITLSWGEVFDSESKEPISGVIVRIFDEEFKKLLETKVTDDEGRFEFLVEPSRYYIRTVKDGYLFPSKKEKGYKGEVISITEETKKLVNVKIPMDIAR